MSNLSSRVSLGIAFLFGCIQEPKIPNFESNLDQSIERECDAQSTCGPSPLMDQSMQRDQLLPDEALLCSTPLFTEELREEGREVMTVLIHDLDQDGHEDIIFNEQLDNKLKIIWGNGQSSFSNAEVTALDMNRSGSRGAIGDVDQDGDLDIVWGSQDHGTIQYFERLSPRGFKQPVTIDESSSPGNLYLLDLNQDGHLDILFQMRTEGCIARRLGNSRGSFYPSTCLLENATLLNARNLPDFGDIEVIARVDEATNRYIFNSEEELQGYQLLNVDPLEQIRMVFYYDINKDNLTDLVIYGADRSGQGMIIEVYQLENGGTQRCAPTKIDTSIDMIGDLNQDQLIDYIRHETCGYCSSKLFIHMQIKAE